MLENILPEKLSNILPENVCEIRLRNGYPMAYSTAEKYYKTTQIVTKNSFDFVLEKVTEHSLYALTEKLNNGFLSLSNGVRIGVAGEAVMDGEKVHIIKNISSLVIRIPHQIFGVSDFVEINGNFNQNLLIVSPPACGKTTMIRDLARRISNAGKNVVILDERKEISGAVNGKFIFDVGQSTDAIIGLPKKYAYVNALRSMNPDYIITDELVGINDINGILSAYYGGVNVVATMHGANEKVFRGEFAPLKEVFDRIIVLSRTPKVGRVVKDIMLNREANYV